MYEICVHFITMYSDETWCIRRRIVVSLHVCHRVIVRRRQSKKGADVTVVGYYFCGEPIPYRITVPGKRITLAQFKQLITKRGNYRWVQNSALTQLDGSLVQNL